jgi:adenylate cyclase
MFFSLIRGLDEVSETMDPVKFVSLLNEYLSAQTEIIDKQKGHIDKFVREEIVAVWGVPEPKPEDAYRAVRAAIECQDNLEKLNSSRKKMGEHTFGVSIGINNGEVVSGNMGSQQKMDYTVIGDAVNTAARIMAKGAEGEVWISESTYELVKDRIKCQELEPIKVKGKKEPLKVYRAVSVKAS